MNRLHTISLSAAALALALASCSTKQYQVASVERTRILIDSRYDNSTDPEVQKANAALLVHKKQVDAEMNPVQGYAATDLWVKRPESPLSNLLADILVWSSAKFDEQNTCRAEQGCRDTRQHTRRGSVREQDMLPHAQRQRRIGAVRADSHAPRRGIEPFAAPHRHG